MLHEGFRVSFPDAHTPGGSFQLDITPEVGIALAEGRAEFPFALLSTFPYDLTMSPHAALLGLLKTQSQLFHQLVYSPYDVSVLDDAVIAATYSMVLPLNSSNNRYPQSDLSVEMEEALSTANALSQGRPIEPSDLLYGLLQSSSSILQIFDNVFKSGAADMMSKTLKGIIESSHGTHTTS